MRIVVDLPAPLGPTKPVTRPGLTVKERSSTASVLPYRLLSPCASMVASMTLKVRGAGARRIAPRSRLSRPPSR